MANGLRVIVRQCELGDVEAEVIVIPTNSDLSHDEGTAKAILLAAGKKVDDECSEYIKQFGKVERVMSTTAGQLKPGIKHVIHAVGPKSNEDCNLVLIHDAVLDSLEYAEHVLNSASIAVPAINSRIFGIPKIDRAKELYQAVSQFDGTVPRFVKTVQLVNSNKGVTYLINKEFAWWCGGVHAGASQRSKGPQFWGSQFRDKL